MKVASVGQTDIGLVRKLNQDAFALFPECDLHMVADGMGGRPAGEVASKITVEAIQDFILKATGTLPDPRRGPERRIRSERKAASNRRKVGERRVRSETFHDLSLLYKAIAHANIKVIEAAQADASCRGMGTTVVILLARPTEVAIGFLGDSRAYLYRAGALTRLTQDHSLVNEYIRLGMLTPEAARTHPFKHVLSRGVGTGTEVRPETFKRSVQPKDLFLLCTDGLSNMIDDNEINDILTRTQGTLSLAAGALIEGAKKKGGKDNITVVLAQYE